MRFLKRQSVWLLFQCSSASRKFLNFTAKSRKLGIDKISVLFSEPKIPQFGWVRTECVLSQRISVLFSEPKIPQCVYRRRRCGRCGEFQCSSASRKFLNSVTTHRSSFIYTFQCSSASRKFLNRAGAANDCAARAFQCSSASRKFLNALVCQHREHPLDHFSALQRAENSSIRDALLLLSLFSNFSALQRAENSSIIDTIRYGERAYEFQCSSASRKFLNIDAVQNAELEKDFSALQRAENSSMGVQTTQT